MANKKERKRERARFLWLLRLTRRDASPCCCKHAGLLCSPPPIHGKNKTKPSQNTGRPRRGRSIINADATTTIGRRWSSLLLLRPRRPPPPPLLLNNLPLPPGSCARPLPSRRPRRQRRRRRKRCLLRLRRCWPRPRSRSRPRAKGWVPLLQLLLLPRLLCSNAPGSRTSRAARSASCS